MILKILLNTQKENADLKHLNDSKAFIEYSNDMDDIYKDNQEYNLNKKRSKKVLIAFDGMIANMLSSNKLNPIVIELFIRARKLNISLVFLLHNLILLYRKLLG